LGELGLGLRGGLKPSPEDYQLLIEQISTRDDAHIVQMMLLRSLSQAVYQAENLGHFGLNYPGYAHFTSPIRRYPDLLVHRGIRSVICSKERSKLVKRVRGASDLPKKKIYPYDDAAIAAFGARCSLTERRADEATREVNSWLKCEYLREHVGTEFEGVVSAVTSFGLFVELNDLYIEGLVHITALPCDYYRFDHAQQRLVGERTGRSFQLGAAIKVLVAAVNLDERKIDLEPVGLPESRKKRGGTSGARTREKSAKGEKRGGKGTAKRAPKAAAGKAASEQDKPKTKSKAKPGSRSRRRRSGGAKKTAAGDAQKPKSS
jgi:ribonuclease R